ncbi:MAG: NUDIX hydrolase [Candidatus Eisenbacteria bacterium]|uniref:NUDIX hydrolase n=1 Tax=Eiseniibacteriota bacterium TaxID=2212470 RepID=A0A938BMM4_UNCEI|nr:NUDIX hydrolase [Candidatus Eisenbacteria bacterium]
MRRIRCTRCGGPVEIPFPLVAVDCIVPDEAGRVLLIRRRFPPPGWALPGGFVDAGESLETAVARELLEETGLRLTALAQFHAYSEPSRDPRHPMVSVVFVGRGQGSPRAGDDAGEAAFFALGDLPAEMAFDHRAILDDYARRRYPAEPE